MRVFCHCIFEYNYYNSLHRYRLYQNGSNSAIILLQSKTKALMTCHQQTMKVKAASGVASAVSPPRDDARIHQHSLSACVDTHTSVATTQTTMTTMDPLVADQTSPVTTTRTSIAKTSSLPACASHRTVTSCVTTMRPLSVRMADQRPLSASVGTQRPRSACVATTRPLSAYLTHSETVV